MPWEHARGPPEMPIWPDLQQLDWALNVWAALAHRNCLGRRPIARGGLGTPPQRRIGSLVWRRGLAYGEQVWGAEELRCEHWKWVTCHELAGSKFRFRAALVVDVTVLCNLIFQRDEAKEAQTQ